MSEPNISVNPASQSGAAEWVDTLQRTRHFLALLKRSIRATGTLIVGPATIVQPPQTIPRDWLADLAAAFASRAWEITTAEETFEVAADRNGFGVKRRLFPDLSEGEFGPGHWFYISPTQRTWSPEWRAVEDSYRLGDAALLFGSTFSSVEANRRAKQGEGTPITRLKSNRALIIIVNRVTVFGANEPALPFSLLSRGPMRRLASARRIRIAEDTLVYAFVHELAAHAGRMTAGKASLHGDATVESIVAELKEMFPKDVENAHTLQVSAALNAAATALQRAK